MKKISYPFELKGQVTVHFKHEIHPMFFEAKDSFCKIDIDRFAVKSFSYSMEHHMLSVSLLKAISTADMSDSEFKLDGFEIENDVISVDVKYCLFNACIISSTISLSNENNSNIDSIKISRPLTIELK